MFSLPASFDSLNRTDASLVMSFDRRYETGTVSYFCSNSWRELGAHRPHSFDLADAATHQVGGLFDASPCLSQRHDARVHGGVCLAAGIAPGLPGKFYPLALSLTAIFVVVVRHLQRQSRQQLLDGLQDDLRNALRLVYQVGHARHCQSSAHCAD